jgi:hypothetical protein
VKYFKLLEGTVIPDELVVFRDKLPSTHVLIAVRNLVDVESCANGLVKVPLIQNLPWIPFGMKKKSNKQSPAKHQANSSSESLSQSTCMPVKSKTESQSMSWNFGSACNAIGESYDTPSGTTIGSREEVLVGTTFVACIALPILAVKMIPLLATTTTVASTTATTAAATTTATTTAAATTAAATTTATTTAAATTAAATTTATTTAAATATCGVASGEASLFAATGLLPVFV